MENDFILLQKPCQTRIRRLILLLGMLACTILVFRTYTLPSENVLPPSFPTTKFVALWKSKVPKNGSSTRSLRIGELSLLSDSGNSTSEIFKEDMDTETSENGREVGHANKTKEMNENLDKQNDYELDDGSELDEEVNPDNEFSINLGNGVVVRKVKDSNGGFITLMKVNKSEDVSSIQKVEETGVGQGLAAVRDGYATTTDDVVLSKIEHKSSNSGSLSPPYAHSPLVTSYLAENMHEADMKSSGLAINSYSNISSSGNLETKVVPGKDNSDLSQSYKPITSIVNYSAVTSHPLPKKKKKHLFPPKSILEIDDLLTKARRSYRVVRPRWSSARDQQLLTIKSQIDHPPISKNNPELHVPAFRNVSMFKRSYELMERTLKVYVYKEGKRPIFHQPLLKGLYASEGWFMKMVEGNRRYTVKDPRRAHLFYMPFSSRFLQFSLYVPNSHNRTNLRGYLRSYVDMIAAKYPFWNRTFGTDHFLVACHDWAPYETRHTMERAIRALCNADLSEDFKVGKDVSLPETYVRSGRNPLRDLGGKPAKERSILAFYAGKMHGYLRSILLHYWENKDPDMKIYGPFPPGVKSKMNYIQHMKSSKYCICPRGYEVNSPRIVESIFYECVPVIISDNYVPPFFEVLNWDAFAVFVAEADIPRLKEILLSIPEERYLSLQMGVRKVQKHFLWHIKPVKYDLFHMILHSIWYNRLYTMKPR